MPHTDMSIPALLRTRATEQPDVTAYTFMDGELDGTGNQKQRGSAHEHSRRPTTVKHDVPTAIWRSPNRQGELQRLGIAV